VRDVISALRANLTFVRKFGIAIKTYLNLPMHENEIARIIVDSCIKIHMQLGPGLLETVYEEVLSYVLTQSGLMVSRQQNIPVFYNDIEMGIGFRADLIVEDKVIIELKSVETLLPLHAKQLTTYLKLTDLRLGLLINFNVPLMKSGITRIVNGLTDSD
jgi:GxxExxY protein